MGLFSAVKSVVSSGLKTVSTALKSTGKAIISTVKSSAQKTSNALFSALAGAKNSIASSAKNISGAIGNLFSSIGQTASGSASSNTTKLYSALGKVGPIVKTSGTNTANNLFSSVSGASTPAQSSGGDILADLYKSIEGLVPKQPPTFTLPTLDLPQAAQDILNKPIDDPLAAFTLFPQAVALLPNFLTDVLRKEYDRVFEKQFNDPTEAFFQKAFQNNPALRDYWQGLGLSSTKGSPVAILAAVAMGAASIIHVFSATEPIRRTMLYTGNKVIPNNLGGPSDLVRMEVREVFDPVFREQQLAKNASSTFYELMTFHGFGKERAEDFWAAHWELPSTLQGYEMFYRLRPGKVDPELVFTEDDLDKLLTRNDVLPYYIPRLKEVAYQPINRIDIRRLRRMGFLTKETVEERYLDLGYSPKDANLLAEFTEFDVTDDERALTRADVYAAYLEDVVDDKFVVDYFDRQGYDSGEIDIVMQVWDKRKEKAKPKERDLRVSKADLVYAYKNAIISPEEFKGNLLKNGYSNDEIALIVAIEDFKAQTANAK